jgi:hypothetical protein
VAVPNISGRISKTADGKINLLFYLHTDPGSTDAPSLSAELRRGGDLIGSLPLKMPADPNRQTIPYLTTLGANSLRAGKYEMTVQVRNDGDTETGRAQGVAKCLLHAGVAARPRAAGRCVDHSLALVAVRRTMKGKLK